MTPERREKVDWVLNRRQPDLTVLMDRVHKPHNMSAVIRTCEAVGIHEVHAIPGEDGLPIMTRASQGAEHWVKLTTHADAVAAAEGLLTDGFTLVAANFSARAKNFRDYDYTQPTAVVLGTEHFGLSREVLRLCSSEVIIPMMGMTQSLNVSVACAIIIYEAQRQREAAGYYEQRRISLEAWQQYRFEWLHPKLADYCRRHDLDYPALDENGELNEPLPH